ncbi:MAG TPA: RDD family protein [Longimicrobium sp.]
MARCECRADARETGPPFGSPPAEAPAAGPWPAPELPAGWYAPGGAAAPAGAPPSLVQQYAAGYDEKMVLRRLLATVVDYAALIALLPAAEAVLGNARYQELLPLWIGLQLLYFPLLEGLRGVTLGKWLAGTRVVGPRGTPPGVLRACVRTLLRPVEVNPCLFGGAPAGLFAFLSRHHQRIGDSLAGTYVLLTKDAGDAAARQP